MIQIFTLLSLFCLILLSCEESRNINTRKNTFYDNISTRNGQFDKDFSALSWSEFDETSPSSAGLSVSEYRNSNNAFVSDLVDALGNEIDWAKVGSTQENIIRRPGDTEFRETGSTISTKNYDSRLTFAAEIAKTLKKK